MGNARARRLDNAGGFMAIDSRERAAPGAIHVENIAVTDGAGGKFDADFAGARLGQFNVFNHKRLAEFAAYGCSGFHCICPVATGPARPAIRNRCRPEHPGLVSIIHNPAIAR